MSNDLIIIPGKAVSVLKKMAKRRRTQSQKPHHANLEAVAHEAGWSNWNAVKQAAAVTEAHVRTIETQLFVLADIKEAVDAIGTEFAKAPELLALREADILAWLRRSDVDDAAAPASDRELLDFLHNNFVGLRFCGAEPLPDRQCLPHFLEQRIALTDSLVWLRGQCLESEELYG